MPVYMIRAGQDGPVKIGHSSDFPARFRELQSANVQTLTVERLIQGGLEEERWLHRHYASRHITREWFVWCDTMRTVVPLARNRGIVRNGVASAIISAIELKAAEIGLEAHFVGRVIGISPVAWGSLRSSVARLPLNDMHRLFSAFGRLCEVKGPDYVASLRHRPGRKQPTSAASHLLNRAVGAP